MPSLAGGSDSEDKNAHVTQPLTPFREAFKGPNIVAGGFIKESAEQEIKAGGADLIAFGETLACIQILTQIDAYGALGHACIADRGSHEISKLSANRLVKVKALFRELV